MLLDLFQKRIYHGIIKQVENNNITIPFGENVLCKQDAMANN